jgi:hypothetical protein
MGLVSNIGLSTNVLLQEGQKRSVHRILEAGAQGFTYTGEQDRYDECESAINEVLQNIRSLSRQWKSVIAKSKYYTALGYVTNAAIEKILSDILALPDITEVESKRLAELCRIVNALEGMFVDDPMQVCNIALESDAFVLTSKRWNSRHLPLLTFLCGSNFHISLSSWYGYFTRV